MSTLFSILFFVFCLVIVPLIALGYILESKDEKIKRLKKKGFSQQAIANKLKVSRYRVRKAW